VTLFGRWKEHLKGLNGLEKKSYRNLEKIIRFPQLSVEFENQWPVASSIFPKFGSGVKYSETNPKMDLGYHNPSQIT